MSADFFELDFKERDFWVFFSQNDGPVEIRPECKRFACTKCEKVDDLKALQSGITKGLPIPKRNVDGFTTNDLQVVVSSRARETLEGVSGFKAHFFPMPSSPDFQVMFPSKLIFAPKDSHVYRPSDLKTKAGEVFHLFGKPCKECGRTPEITWSSELFEPPADLVASGVMLETKLGYVIAWIVNRFVADAIKKAKLKGIKASRL